MKYIETFREGERINEIFLCKYKQSAVTRNGKPYENVILQDKTGTVYAKIWDPGSQGIESFETLDYISVVGDITSFQGTLQMNIKRVRKAQPGEYTEADYLPPYLQKLLAVFFQEDEEFARRFCSHSAAKSVHHGFVGGLLEHTLSVTRLCAMFCEQYSILNRDLLLTAAMFHDIGKLDELSDFPANDYTDEGQLLGHIMIGTEKVGA